jgi:hypothetical protein
MNSDTGVGVVVRVGGGSEKGEFRKERGLINPSLPKKLPLFESGKTLQVLTLWELRFE